MKTRNLTQNSFLEHFHSGGDLLGPMAIGSVQWDFEVPDEGPIDALITAYIKTNTTQKYNFHVEVQAKSTPQVVRSVIGWFANSYSHHHLLIVPFLAEARLKELEAAGFSGVDLCGNGIISIPNEVLIYRTGNKNLYPDSRPVSNPYRGKAALVARAFFAESVFLGEQRGFDALGEIREAIASGGTSISLSQISKAISAFQEDGVIGGQGRSVYLLDPHEIMQQLANAWRPVVDQRVFVRLPQRTDSLRRLNQDTSLSWAIIGESAAGQYTPFTQGGPVRVAVSNMSSALELLDAEEESVPNFADVELIETEELGFYFQNVVKDGVRWASKLQTWIELKNGDARQQSAAEHVRKQIVE